MGGVWKLPYRIFLLVIIGYGFAVGLAVRAADLGAFFEKHVRSH